MRNLLCDWFHWRHWTRPFRDDNGEYRMCTECSRRIPFNCLVLDMPRPWHPAPQPKGETFASDEDFKKWFNKNIS